jgi:hypothetical protein
MGWPDKIKDLSDPQAGADAELARHVVAADFSSADVDVVVV